MKLKKIPLEYLLAQTRLNIEQLQQNGIIYSSEAEQDFSLLCPPAFTQKIEKNNPRDPLLLQILPQLEETRTKPGFSTDPLTEQAFLLAPGLIQKYQHRVLLIVTQSCGIHCRYCFRRHFPYADNRLNPQQLAVNIQIIHDKREIEEVILSGGDPLCLSNDKLAPLIQQLAHIPHLKRLRIHSRQPVIEPGRIDQDLLSLLTQFQGAVIMVLHINHANEIDPDLGDAVRRLKQQYITVFNQSVLLKHINDNVTVLKALSEQLFATGIQPYYLHYLDPVQGAQHFQVSLDQAKAIYEQLQQQLPGYLVPKLVQETAYDAYKKLLL